MKGNAHVTDGGGSATHGPAHVWLVLGGTSAVARAFALQAGRRGGSVVLAGRDVETLRATANDLEVRTGCRASVLRLDVEERAEHEAFVRACLAEAAEAAEAAGAAGAAEATQAAGTLNVFCAIGMMPDQDDIDRNPALVERVAAVNYSGPATLLSLLAPTLEEQGRGSVVVLGSVAGDRGRESNYVYGSTKAGLHTYLAGLRIRLARSGVRVTTVKPGFLDTRMTWGRSFPLPVASPEGLASACWKYAERGKEVAYYPWFWRPVMAVVRALPAGVFRRLGL